MTRPEVLRAAVTSPGGTTAAGLRALEDAGVRAAFLDAVDAATAPVTRAGRRLNRRHHAWSHWQHQAHPLPCSQRSKG